MRQLARDPGKGGKEGGREGGREGNHRPWS